MAHYYVKTPVGLESVCGLRGCNMAEIEVKGHVKFDNH